MNSKSWTLSRNAKMPLYMDKRCWSLKWTKCLIMLSSDILAGAVYYHPVIMCAFATACLPAWLLRHWLGSYSEMIVDLGLFTLAGTSMPVSGWVLDFVFTLWCHRTDANCAHSAVFWHRAERSLLTLLTHVFCCGVWQTVDEFWVIKPSDIWLRSGLDHR